MTEIVAHDLEVILDEIERIRGMYGYTLKDEQGIDCSVWMGASLHRIENAARRVLREVADGRRLGVDFRVF